MEAGLRAGELNEMSQPLPEALFDESKDLVQSRISGPFAWAMEVTYL